ncbi:MAG TPA: VIT domain-containing protein [Planctomycetota bacterium]|nr:VIT domain-containing protein [Planctomycetota bacterium]
MVALEAALKPTIAEDRTRAFGSLCVTRGERRARLPLAGVRVRARVADRVAEISMEQKFTNPFAEPLEAVYLFPLPGGSAVSAFELQVGARVIKGLVKERGDARRVYTEAVQQGKRAALLEQERDDVFTVQVGNLPPGEEVTVRIVTSERLPFFEDGATELRLPLLVAPRYIPGKPLPRDPVGDGVEWDTDQVPDASRLTPPRLAPGFDPKVALSIEVEVADGALSELACSQHATRMANGTIALARQDELLDRDFILRWKLAGDTVRTRFLSTKDGFGMLSILPPKREGFLGLARDVVFILDRSGSMSGVKMSSAARACSLLLATLGPRDRFAITAFDDSTEWFSNGAFVKADEAGLEAGDKFLRTIESRGGTELDPAMKETLELIGKRKADEGRVPVVVILTDGQIGNESAVFQRIQKEGGDTRIFTVGIDTAVNEAFLKRVSSLGGGTCTCVVPGEALEDALRGIGREIGAPLVVDVTVEGAEDLAPGRVPDLFAGRAATVFFRVKKGKKITVSGKFADGKSFKETVKPEDVELPAIAQLWARARVTDLEDRFRLEPARQGKIREEIIALAIRHTLLTRFTSFVVVDESEIVNKGGEVHTVVQPVHMPAQWDMKMEEAESCKEAAAPRGAGVQAMGAACASVVPPPPPPPPMACTPAPAPMKRKKLFGVFGGKDDEEINLPQETGPSASERKAFEKAVGALRKALKAAKAELEKGKVPSPKAIDQARKALIQELAGSPLGTTLGALQRLLRSALLELVAAMGAKGATTSVLLPALEAALKSLGESAPAGEASAKFWEKMI